MTRTPNQTPNRCTPKMVQIAGIKQKLAESEDPVPVLADSLSGRSALVISCGPSMRHWRNVLEDLRGKDAIVVCVKQAIIEVRELCDLHFINLSNLQNYESYNSSTISFFMSIPKYPIFTNYDVLMAMDESILSSKITLSVTRDFESHTLDKVGVVRPWGPGIMQEMVLYVLMHMGVKDITVVGWDIAEDFGSNQHFYDHGQNPAPTNTQIDWRALSKSIARKLGIFRPLQAVVHLFRHRLARRAFDRGEICFKTRMQPGEADLVASSIPSLLRWFRSQGVEIRVISDSKWMN